MAKFRKLSSTIFVTGLSLLLIGISCMYKGFALSDIETTPKSTIVQYLGVASVCAVFGPVMMILTILYWLIASEKYIDE